MRTRPWLFGGLLANYPFSVGPDLGVGGRHVKTTQIDVQGCRAPRNVARQPQDKIFLDDRDRIVFLETLSAARELFGVRWRSFNLMNTHYHLKVQTPEGNISQAMKFVNGAFTQSWNRRHRTTGHLFEGRFKSPLVENGYYSRNVVHYIALNPVEACYVRHAAEWPWSSHRALAGLVSPPEFLDSDWLRNCFDGATLQVCQRQYQRFIDDEELRLTDFGDEFVVGSADDPVQRSRVDRRDDARPRGSAQLPGVGAAASSRTLFAGFLDDLDRRNVMVIRAQVVYGYTQAEIARALGVHSNTFSKINAGD